MIKTLPTDVQPVIDDARMEVLLSHPNVQGYLNAVEEIAPGLDLTVDRCIGIGLLAIRETRAGRLDEHLRLGARTFDADEFRDLVAAALAFLLPLVEEGERVRASA